MINNCFSGFIGKCRNNLLKILIILTAIYTNQSVASNDFDVGIKFKCACNKRSHVCKIVIDYPPNIRSVSLQPHSIRPIIFNKYIVKLKNKNSNNSYKNY